MCSGKCRDSWMLRVLGIRNGGVLNPKQHICSSSSKAQRMLKNKRVNRTSVRDGRQEEGGNLLCSDQWNHELTASAVDCTGLHKTRTMNSQSLRGEEITRVYLFLVNNWPLIKFSERRSLIFWCMTTGELTKPPFDNSIPTTIEI